MELDLDQQYHSPNSSLKNKLKQSLCLSCCFPSNRRQSSESPSSDDRPALLRAPTFWMKSADLPEFKDKCRNLIGRIGGRHRRHSTSADFHYDALSYALNFDDGGFENGGEYDDPPIRSFSSRLQASTSRPSPPLRVIPEVDNRVLPSVIAAVS